MGSGAGTPTVVDPCYYDSTAECVDFPKLLILNEKTAVIEVLASSAVVAFGVVGGHTAKVGEDGKGETGK